jgi:hypothetical protein
MLTKLLLYCTLYKSWLDSCSLLASDTVHELFSFLLLQLPTDTSLGWTVKYVRHFFSTELGNRLPVARPPAVKAVGGAQSSAINF